MSDVFISYSRRDSEFMAVVHKRLVDDGHDVWVDWEDIPPTADWWEEIRSAIEEAHVFAFIISPNSVRSDVCRDEIQYAIDNNKRFIPILYQEPREEDKPYVHPAIQSHNWIYFQKEEQYEESFRKLIDSFSSEPWYLRQHTRLLIHAKEWQENERQVGYLLKGAELREFQQWLLASQEQNPKPTELQYDYILASQTRRTREQLRLAGGLIIGIVIVAILSLMTFVQRQQISQQNALGTISAQEQAATAFAQSTQIAAQSTRIADVQDNAANLIQQANLQNTQSALQNQIVSLQETISAFETSGLISPTVEASATVTATSTVTATATVTSTLPPTWTPEPTEKIGSTVESGQASVASFVTATLNPEAIATATVQAQIYATATQIALVSPTPLPSNTAPPTLTARPTVTAQPTVTPREQIQTITYVVQSGDNMAAIAARFGVTIEEIVALNNISNPSQINAGQQMLIPYVAGVETDSTVFVAPRGNDTPGCGTIQAPCQTINHAIEIAEGFVEIRLAANIYTEQLIIDRDLVISGNGVDNTVLATNFTGTIITVNPGVSVYLRGLTLAGSDSTTGGAIVNYGELSLQNLRISNNIATFVGGGIANFGTLFANYVDFSGNYAPYFADIYSAPSGEIFADETMHYSRETSLPQRTRVDGDLNIGVLVEVSTTGGDRLNLRSQPSTTAANPVPLNPGTELLIVDGPQDNNGFRWWRVQTVNGTGGWVADYVDDEFTITAIDSP